MNSFPKPPFPEQTQDPPGSFQVMDPKPDHGELTWVGAGRLRGRVALITGADSGIERAVAIAFSREGADVALCFLDEMGDAADTANLIEDEAQTCFRIPAEGGDPEFHCRAGAASRRPGHPGELRAARAGLDAAYPRHDARREGRQLRPGQPDAAARAARGTCLGLCDAGRTDVELCLGRDDRGDGRAPML
jgi:NAD(P)-dependent dehydrogenase (short-subunit alcohol dehydrogenase family)